jgi:hypothetical protein
MESKGQPGAALVASPILSLQSSDLYGVFHVFLLPLAKSPKGDIYIVGFRSRRSRRVQDCVETMHEGEVGPHHAARGGPAWCPLFSSLLRSPLTSSYHSLLFPKKVTWKKVWVRLMSGRSLKLKTCKNKEICFTVLKSNERGLFIKTPESMANKSMSL